MALRSTASEAICGNLEIMENILGFLQDDYDDLWSLRTNDLSAACLVSKAFFLEPALNILWRHLESLWPVLRLFPTLQKDEESGDWSLKGTIHNDHLQRVLFYSRRIRSIEITSPLLSPDTLTILSSRMQPLQPFLPLRELTFEIHPLKSILDPFLFLMPLTLTTISIIGVSSPSRVAAASLLQHLSSNHDTLKHLSLTGCIDSTFLPILLECTSMRSLNLTSEETVFSAEYIQGLSNSLSSLETLTLNRFRYNLASNPISARASFTPATFASLLHLTLTGDLASISDILSTLKAPQLRDITLSFSSLIRIAKPEAATFAACVARVAKINDLEGKGNLQSVKILHTRPMTIIDLSAFDALFALRPTIQVLHLRQIQLHFESEKEYRNPLNTKLIYPNLVDLHLLFVPSEAAPTISVLESLGRASPNLKTLHISIHAGKEEEITKIDTFDTLDLPPHGLETLVFHDLPRHWNFSVSLAVALARYLYYLFPTLSSAEYYRLTHNKREWLKGVQDMLKMCQGKESARRRHLGVD